MKVKLSKAIAELEKDKIRYVWEPPDIYEEVHANNIWLVYGRKGVGKSTLVDYLGTDSQSSTVIVVRPRQTNLFAKVIAALSASPSDERLLEESAVTALDFVLTAKLISDTVLLKGPVGRGSPEETLYNFMTKNGLSGGSALKKAIDFISALSGADFKLIPNLTQALDKATGTVTLEDAKTALCQYLRDQGKSVVLCIDDIDQIGFTYSPTDRLFINGLVIYMVRSNLSFIDNQVMARVLLTTPSELFFQSSLWGSDWVSSKSRCLNWNHLEHLQELVNKRIAVELDIRKKNPRFPDDKYSVDVEHTWKRLFPMTVTNKCGRSESAFEYIVRHTFYTPRQILDLCDSILAAADPPPDPEKTGTVAVANEWSAIIQTAVEQFTCRAEKDIRDMFGMIYAGIDEVFKAFEGRPNLWHRTQLQQFVQDRKLLVTRKHDSKQYAEEELIAKLQHLGFVGLGSRTLDAPTGTESYQMRFAFLEEYPSRKSWELAAISPMFYDAYDIKPVEKAIVKPHDRLTLSNAVVHKLTSYDVQLNCFRE